MTTSRAPLHGLLIAALVGVMGMWGDAPATDRLAAGPARAVIVQAASAATAADEVGRVGARITHTLGVIDAVGARVTDRQARELRARGMRLYDDGSVRTAQLTTGSTLTGSTTGTSSNGAPPAWFVKAMGADRLHAEGVTGNGVTMAVLDTGFTGSGYRFSAKYDAITNSTTNKDNDWSGHGTHVTSSVANTQKDMNGVSLGVAPSVSLVSVKAFDTNGAGTYMDVIRGIDWVISNRSRYGIQILNCSFSAPPRSFYWEDPLNQAIMRAWQAGIVVVASAGNGGPSAMSVGVPGNVPYVITVGAMTDSYTTANLADDRLASFSATGPTYEGFVKPEIVAPGGHIYAMMNGNTSQIALQYPEFSVGKQYFWMSGTSQAAAMVSGVVALMLHAHPLLTPDQVKFRLMASARVAVTASGNRAYSIFQQGAGMVDAYAAVRNTIVGSANQGMSVTLDLANIQHYGGPANQRPDGSFYLMGMTGDGYTWNGSYSGSAGYLWSNGYLWSDSYLWSNGFLWSDGYLWSNGYLWSSSYLWSNGLVEPMSINLWVPQQ